MKILIVADEEQPALWDCFQPERLEGVDLILSAGDLKAEYLRFLVTMASCPLLYIHGNHDTHYIESPPEGCECIDGRLFTAGGLRILGLGGSLRYNNGAHQYTESQMRRRILRLAPALFRSGGADIVLAHAPVAGYGDLEDLPHRGFQAFLPLIDRYHPRYFIHGHVHSRYNPTAERCFTRGTTTIINAGGSYLLDLT